MVFCFVQNFFSDNTRVRILIFFQIITLGYMTKTEPDYYLFSSTKIRIFFSATLGIRVLFLRKKTYPPWKLNGPSLTPVDITIDWCMLHVY